MGKYDKKKPKKSRKGGVIAVAVALTAVLGVGGFWLLGGQGDDPAELPSASQTDPGLSQSGGETTQGSVELLQIQEVRYQDDKLVISTSFGDVSYLAAFSDIVQVSAVNGENTWALEFRAKLSSGEEPIFTIWFDGEGQIPLGTLSPEVLDTGVTVSGTLWQPGEGLSDDDRTTFFAAQESFNDVVASLMALDSFVPAE